MFEQNEYIGVISPFDLMSTSLKKEAIFFDKIAIPNVLNNFFLRDTMLDCPIRSIEYLIDSGIIIDPVHAYIGEKKYLKKIGKDLHNRRLELISERERALKNELRIPREVYPMSDLNSLIENLPKNIISNIKRIGAQLSHQYGVPISKFISSIHQFNDQLDYDRRGIAIDLSRRHNLNAHPVYAEKNVLNDDFKAGKDHVINLVIEQLPEPDCEKIAWEKIIDFRSDPVTQKLRTYLRKWISDTAKSNLALNEIVESMEYYCAKYEEHINFHKMKTKNGSLETLLMIPAEMLEGVIRLKPTQTVKALFAFKKANIELLEQEKNAPGRDLAYILKCKDEFKE
jgi:hypothetical protein